METYKFVQIDWHDPSEQDISFAKIREKFKLSPDAMDESLNRGKPFYIDQGVVAVTMKPEALQQAVTIAAAPGWHGPKIAEAANFAEGGLGSLGRPPAQARQTSNPNLDAGRRPYGVPTPARRRYGH